MIRTIIPKKYRLKWQQLCNIKYEKYTITKPLRVKKNHFIQNSRHPLFSLKFVKTPKI